MAQELTTHEATARTLAFTVTDELGDGLRDGYHGGLRHLLGASMTADKRAVTSSMVLTLARQLRASTVRLEASGEQLDAARHDLEGACNQDNPG